MVAERLPRGGVPNYGSASKANSANFQLGGDDPNWLANFGAQAQEIRGGAEDMQKQAGGFHESAYAAQGRQGPRADLRSANATLAGAAGRGQQQGDLAARLQEFGEGPAPPSAAQAQLRQGRDAALAASLSQARSGSGFGENVNAMTAAGGQAAQTVAQAGNESAAVAAQEQQQDQQRRLQAFGQAGDVLGAARGADLDAAGQQTAQQQMLADVELRRMGLNDEQMRALSQLSVEEGDRALAQMREAQGLDLAAQNSALQGRMSEEQLNAQLYGTDAEIFQARMQNIQAQREMDQQRGRDVAGSIIGGVSAIGSFFGSDERMKTNITPTSVPSYRRLNDDERGLADRTVNYGAGHHDERFAQRPALSNDPGVARRDFETYQDDDTAERFRALAPDVSAVSPDGAESDAGGMLGKNGKKGTQALGDLGRQIMARPNLKYVKSDVRSKGGMRPVRLAEQYAALRDD